jgi:hypothetical protein
MSKYIDKEKLLDSVYKSTPLIPSMAGMTAEAMRLKIAVLIDNFDSIDVVHCKECNHWDKVDTIDGVNYGTCERKCTAIRQDAFLNENWFCGDGKERNDE